MNRVLLCVVLTLLAGTAGGLPGQELMPADRQRAAALFRAGRDAVKAEDFRAAEESLKAAIQVDARFAAAHCALGQTYMATRRYAEAVEALRACKRISLEDVQRRSSEARASDLQIQDEVQDLRDLIIRLEALHDATRQTDITKLEARIRGLEEQRRREQPGATVPAEISFALGTAYLRNGMLKEAEHEYLDALDARSSYGEAHNNLAVVYMGLADWDKARQQAAEAEKAGFDVAPQMTKDIEARKAPALLAPGSPPVPTASEAAAADAKVSIEHTALGCVLASRFPRVEARIGPAADVERVWVRFRSDRKGGWYAVPLRPEGVLYVGLLPMPKWLHSFDYYIEAVDPKATMTRTPEYSTTVVEYPQECAESEARSVADASGLMVEKPPGAARKERKTVPSGFSGRGTTGDIGVFDLSTRTVALITGGVLGALGVAAATLHGDAAGPARAPEPPVSYNVIFRSSVPAPGSQVSLSQASLTMVLTVQETVNHTSIDPRSPAFIRVDFYSARSSAACISIRVPGGSPANTVQDFVVSGPLATAAECSLPFTTTQVAASLLTRGGELFFGSTPFPLGVTYTFVR